jgi:hypothetical protein
MPQTTIGFDDIVKLVRGLPSARWMLRWDRGMIFARAFAL